MSEETDRLANLLATVAIGLSDEIGVPPAGESGPDPTAAAALVALLDFSSDGPVSKLALGLGLSHSGAVRLVDRLVEAGWVRRKPGSDFRSIRIGLTRPGRTVANRIRRERADRTLDVCQGLTERQRRELSRTCEVIIANLTRHRLAERAAGRPPAGGALCRLCDFVACGRLDGRCPTQIVVAEAQRSHQGGS